ncbi:MAG: YbjN domain-containing protein [Candidatus Eremiobacterota bacterium]
MLRTLFKERSALERYKELIEEILSGLGIDPEENREEIPGERAYSWCVQRGSATVFIELLSEQEEGYFMVDCPILLLPSVGLERFFRRLLELNDRLVEATLTLRGTEVHLVGIRPLKGMDAGEAEEMIDRISAYADNLDNQLSDEFGAPLWGGGDRGTWPQAVD